MVQRRRAEECVGVSESPVDTGRRASLGPEGGTPQRHEASDQRPETHQTLDPEMDLRIQTQTDRSGVDAKIITHMPFVQYVPDV